MADDFPPGWHKTVDELLAEWEESGGPLPNQEMKWARAYERSLLRPWVRFPLNGEIYEALEDTEVSFLTQWSVPLTDDGAGILPKGTRVRVEVFDHMPEPTEVYADPLDREIIECLLVPETTRKDPTYAGLSLTISTADLNRRFRLVHGEAV